MATAVGKLPCRPPEAAAKPLRKSDRELLGSCREALGNFGEAEGELQGSCSRLTGMARPPLLMGAVTVYGPCLAQQAAVVLIRLGRAVTGLATAGGGCNWVLRQA